jgi:hypothetical protein
VAGTASKIMLDKTNRLYYTIPTTRRLTMTKTATKTKNITVHSDEIVTVHSDDLYKIAKTLEGMFKKINDLDNKISSRDISGRDIEEALSDISEEMGEAFDTLKTILIQNEVVSGPSYPLTLPKKI